jgi:hypothetical protein
MLSRENITDALRFWETGRIYYNLALLTPVLLAVNFAQAAFDFWVSALPFLIVAAIGANVLYCAAYPADLLIQSSGFREIWRRWRWALWALGTLLALVLEAASLFGFGVLAGFADQAGPPAP